MNWFYWDFAFHITEVDKLAHLTYPFFGVIMLTAIFWWFRVRFRALRRAMILMAIASVVVELVQNFVLHTDKVSGGDLIADGLGILLAGWCVSQIE